MCKTNMSLLLRTYMGKREPPTTACLLSSLKLATGCTWPYKFTWNILNTLSSILFYFLILDENVKMTSWYCGMFMFMACLFGKNKEVGSLTHTHTQEVGKREKERSWKRGEGRGKELALWVVFRSSWHTLASTCLPFVSGLPLLLCVCKVSMRGSYKRKLHFQRKMKMLLGSLTEWLKWS